MAHLSIIPVRNEPSDKSELCTQLLFGDAYKVLEISGNEKWYRIETQKDLYQGWIDHFQLLEISEDFYLKYKNSPKYFNHEPVAFLQGAKKRFPIVLGSCLPFFEGGKANIEQQSFQVEPPKAVSPALHQNQIPQIAFKYLHTPYLWGGKSLFGIDCSGFTQMTFGMAGISLPRDAYRQADCGQALGRLSESRSSTLAFFEREGRIIHVGIILESVPAEFLESNIALSSEERWIIHALDSVRIDKLDEKGIFNIDRHFYTHTLSRLRNGFKNQEFVLENRD